MHCEDLRDCTQRISHTMQNTTKFFAGSLESANSAILATRSFFKDFGRGKNQDFMIIIRCPTAYLFTNNVILQRYIFKSQHVRQRHDVIFFKILRLIR